MFDLLQKPYLNKHNSIVALILAVIAFGAVVTADYLTSDELRFSALYLIIVLMVSWFCWIWWGSLFAFLSAFAEIKVGLLSGHSFSRLVYFYISVGNILFAYLLTAILASIARTLYERARFSARIDHLTGIATEWDFMSGFRLKWPDIAGISILLPLLISIAITSKRSMTVWDITKETDCSEPLRKH
jgi:hypothetical protein